MNKFWAKGDPKACGQNKVLVEVQTNTAFIQAKHV